MTLSHSFSVELAELYGIECAILINHFQFWIEQNKSTGKNFHDGRTWMYQSQKDIAAIYPYWSEDVVFKTIKKLEDFKVIIKGNYNKTSFDKTTWYAFENEKMFTKPSNDGIDRVNRRNQSRQPTEPIPDTNTYTKKIQQQPTAFAAAFSEQKTIKPYECLIPLNLTDDEKIQITKRHDEQKVIEAVKVALAKKKMPDNLGGFIEWACANSIQSSPTPEDVFESNKKIAKTYDGLETNHVRVDVLSNAIEIVYKGCQKDPVTISYDEKGFKEQIENALRKCGFQIPS